MASLLPFGIYTIPEISTVGRNEEELTDQAVPYVVGLARYREIARGQISGDTNGMLKLLVAPETREVLGVHIFGSCAAELVHVGQAVIAMGGTVDYLIDTVFNYPTFAEAYKVAALDAMNRLNELSVARKVA
jgi:NAD(P) transhydrogenase